MGCYDTVLVPCPNCGELYQAQSKSGDCFLKVYNFDNTPLDVMENVNRHAPFECERCGTMFYVKFSPKPEIFETDDIPEEYLPDLSSREDLQKVMEEYYSKLDKK